MLQAFLPALNEICDDFVELLRLKRCPRTQIVDNFQDVANLMGLEGEFRVEEIYFYFIFMCVRFSIFYTEFIIIIYFIYDFNYLNFVYTNTPAVCTLMLGRRMGFLSAKPDPAVMALAGAVKTLFATQRDSTFGVGLWRYAPTKTWRDFRHSEEMIYRSVHNVCATYRTSNINR